MAAMRILTTAPSHATGEVVLSVVGELDMASVADLRAAIRGALSIPGGPIVLDCSRLTFIDAAGLGALVTFANQARDVERLAVLRNTSASMQQVLRITGLGERFDAGMAGIAV